jgi:dGTP triphosphohydrolase
MEPGRDDAGSTGDAEYRQVAIDIAEVLTAAKRDAARIRETAEQDAERIRAEAKATAAAADASAEETRRKSESEAASVVSRAQEQARRIRDGAERTARDLELEAIRHHNEVTRVAEGTEDRVKTMLDAFRQAASDLERLVPAEPRESPDEPERPSHERFDEALGPRLPQVWTIGTGSEVTPSDER